MRHFWQVAVAVVSLISLTWADPRQLGEHGVCWGDGYNIQSGATCASNSAGDELCVWRESHTDRDIWKGQLIHADGTRAWADSGRVLLTRAALEYGYSPYGDIQIIAPTADGWLFAYEERTVGWEYALRLQKLDAHGEPQWPVADFHGLLVTQDLDESFPDVFISDDGSGGALLAWRGDDDGVAVNARRVSANGELVWLVPPVIVDPDSNVVGLSAAADAGGTLYLVWTQGPAYQYRVYASKILPNGVLQWGNGTGGVHVAPGDSSQWAMAIHPVEAGAYVVFGDDRNDSHGDIFAQRLDAWGEAMWPVGGVTISGVPGTASLTGTCASQHAGIEDGMLLTWRDYHNYQDPETLFVQKLADDGTIRWSEHGLPVTIARDLDGSGPPIVSDRYGGAIVNWLVGNSLRAARIDAAGNFIWGGEGGVQVLTDPQYGTFQIHWGDDDWLHLIHEAGWGNARVLVSHLVSTLDGTASPDHVDTLASASPWTGDYSWLTRLSPNRFVTMTPYLQIQIFDTLGNREFGPSGLDLLPDAEPRWVDYFDACADGNGGFFAAWTTWWFNPGSPLLVDVSVVHVSATLNVIGGPNGIVLDGIQDGNLTSVRCVSDGAGGCHIVWWRRDDVHHTATRRLAHVNAQCELLRPTLTLPEELWGVPILSTPERIILGHGSRSTGYSVTCYDDAGTTIWQTALFPAVLPRYIGSFGDGAGGIYVVAQGTGQAGQDIFTQHIDANGERLWGDSGLAVCSEPRDQSLASGVLLAGGDLFVAWSDSLPGDTVLSVWAQRVTPPGERVWPEAGQLLAPALPRYSRVDIVAGISNDVLVTWAYDDYMFHTSYRGTHIGGNGQVTDPWWTPRQGGDLGLAGEMPFYNPPTSDGVGGFILTSYEYRSAGSVDTVMSAYVQRIYDGYVDAADHPAVHAPARYTLAQNYPNPFNPVTEIRFTVPRATDVTLRVFDLLGREVATLVDRQVVAGEYTVLFDAAALASGIYFYRLETAGFTATKKMVLLR
ncbi:T9SS type A sorting domain-containing protein [candidate division KSB1 bacterium]|nr:T9SS type A sorting domain-containing protein [candidate division KSB1 bacterium]